MVFVGISGVFSVLFGAWLAHSGLEFSQLVQLRLAQALQYQFLHTLALLVTLVWCLFQPSRWLVFAGLSFSLGIIGFSGSLYMKTFYDVALFSRLTPFGGISFAIGWATLSFAGVALIKQKKLMQLSANNQDVGKKTL